VTVVQNAVLSLSAIAFSKSDGPVTLTATLNAPSSADITINLAYVGGTATINTDYTAPATIFIPAGASSAFVNITPKNNLVPGPSTTIIITATATNANLSWSLLGNIVTLTNDNKSKITININGSGTVTPPTGVLVDYNGTVTLVPTPVIGNSFSSWGTGQCDAISGDSCILKNVITDRAVTANFIIKKVTVITEKSGSGSGSFSPNSPVISYGGTVTIMATADGSSSFISWANCTTPVGNKCTEISLTLSKTVAARFDLKAPANASGTCRFSGNNEVDAYVFCAYSFNIDGGNSTFKGAIAAKNVVIGSTAGNSFYYDYDIDGNAPPGFRYLNIPRPTEVGNKQ
jgi:hypothetical protein